jgi:hypothetical protein
MRCNQAAFGRQAQSVSIVTQLSIALQHKNASCGKLRQVVYLRHATIKIRETQSGEIVIEIEPP